VSCDESGLADVPQEPEYAEFAYTRSICVFAVISVRRICVYRLSTRSICVVGVFLSAEWAPYGICGSRIESRADLRWSAFSLLGRRTEISRSTSVPSRTSVGGSNTNYLWLGTFLLGFRNRKPAPPPVSSMNSTPSRVKTSLVTVSEWDLLRTDQLVMVFRRSPIASVGPVAATLAEPRVGPPR
jgi:hypothetical protein